jgi:HlyD family secretion protein
LLAKVGLGKASKPAATNVVQMAQGSGTNATDLAEKSPPPLTGNEAPEELMKRMREYRDHGEEPPADLRAKVRELFQSGVIQRPGGGGGGMGPGGPGGAGGPAARPRPPQPAWHTVYLLTTNTPAGGGEPRPAAQALRVKTGVSDGTYTEITDGLKEGTVVVTSAKIPGAPVMAPTPGGASPFGGGGGGMRRF